MNPNNLSLKFNCTRREGTHSQTRTKAKRTTHVRTEPKSVIGHTREKKKAKRATQCRSTPATQNDGRCQFVPRLPREMPRRYGRPNQGQARSGSAMYHACHVKTTVNVFVPVTMTVDVSLPRLPRKGKATVDVSLNHACDKMCRRYRNLRNLLGSASRTSSLTH